MTKLEAQKIAVSMAVRTAMHNIGSGTITGCEFFGTNQGKRGDLKLAA